MYVLKTFNVSVYDPYHTTWFSEIMKLMGKKTRVEYSLSY